MATSVLARRRQRHHLTNRRRNEQQIPLSRPSIADSPSFFNKSASGAVFLLDRRERD